MALHRKLSTALWGSLLILPAGLIGLLIWPGLGRYGEGLLVELLAPELTGFAEFAEYADRFRVWSGIVLGIASAAGFAYWFWLRNRWRALLRRFEPGRVLGYRRLALGGRFLGAAVTAAALGAILILLSAPLRKLLPPSWLILVGGCAAAGALQYLAAIFALGETRRLFAGR